MRTEQIDTILQGDALTRLRELSDESVQCIVTSPPYWGLRDYGHSDQLGLEKTPEEYAAKMVEIFREARRVLRKDGTLWLNLGDSYATTKEGNTNGTGEKVKQKKGVNDNTTKRSIPNGLKPKDLVGIPWRVAFALQSDGWYLRQDIIWSKPNPMPESVADRCTKSHEYIFLLTKSGKYYFDNEAIKEPAVESTQRERYTSNNNHIRDEYKSKHARPYGIVRDRELEYNSKLSKLRSHKNMQPDGQEPHVKRTEGMLDSAPIIRNKRSVWSITTQPYKGAHFATFPEAIPETCILAGTKIGDTVLDPFTGSGTTLAVAKANGRHYLGIELNPEYIKLAEKRLRSVPENLFAPITND